MGKNFNFTQKTRDKWFSSIRRCKTYIFIYKRGSNNRYKNYINSTNYWR